MSAIFQRKKLVSPGTDCRGPSGGDFDGFGHIVGQIESQGYAVVDGALPAPLVDHLFYNFAALERQTFKRAGVGRHQRFQINDFQRRDRIYWLGPEDPTLQDYLAWMDELRLRANRQLFLGLFDYECHYTYYPQGAFYKKHVDAFSGQSNRRLSTILYLNPNWQAGHGGELALYRDGEVSPFLTVAPVYKRLVVFLSEVFPHEVLRTEQARFSLTGWFRQTAPS